MGWGVVASRDEERSEAVVLDVVEAAGDAATGFDESVDGRGAAVARAVASVSK